MADRTTRLDTIARWLQREDDELLYDADGATRAETGQRQALTTALQRLQASHPPHRSMRPPEAPGAAAPSSGIPVPEAIVTQGRAAAEWWCHQQGLRLVRIPVLRPVRAGSPEEVLALVSTADEELWLAVPLPETTPAAPESQPEAP